MKSSEGLITTAAAVLLILALGFITVFSYTRGWQWIDSDHASGMILGRILAEENTLVTSNWLYSTEIRLLHQAIFTMPLFRLLGHHEDWALIRALNILLNNIVLILSYIFLMKSTKIKAKWIFLSAIFLLLPLSQVYWNIVTFGGYYIFFIAQLFFCLGMFINLAANTGSAKFKIVQFVLFLLLSFALGVQGVRALLAVYIPLVLASTFTWFENRKYPILLGCYALAVSGIGYAVNRLLHFWFSSRSYDSILVDDIFSNLTIKFGRILATIPVFFGFSSGDPVLSLRGLSSIAAVIFTIILLYCAFKITREVRHQRHTGEEQHLRSFIAVFFTASLVFNAFVFLMVDQAIVLRFYIPFMILYVPLTALLFDHARRAYKSSVSAVVICAVTLFVFGQGFLGFKALEAKDLNSARKASIEYLLDNNLEFGFASFSNANVITELSNGRIDMAALESRISPEPDGGLYFLIDLLTPAKFLDPQHHEGESFLLLSRGEWIMVNRMSAFSGITPAFDDGNFIIIRYSSAERIHNELINR